MLTDKELDDIRKALDEGKAWEGDLRACLIHIDELSVAYRISMQDTHDVIRENEKLRRELKLNCGFSDEFINEIIQDKPIDF